MKKSQKGSIVVWIVMVLVIILGIGFYFYSQNKSLISFSEVIWNNSSQKTYTDTQFAFSFQYPSNFTAEQNDGDGSMPQNNGWIRIYCADTSQNCSGQEMDIYVSPIAQKLEPQTSARVTTILKNGNYQYAIATKNVYQETSLSPIVDRGPSIDSNTAKQIISTIKFTK